MLTETSLADAVQALCRVEPRFAGVVTRHGVPSLRAMPQGLEGLLLTVTEQFLSLTAAAAIWQRLKTRLAPLSPTDVLACPAETLLELGLSRAKARSFHGIAAAVESGVLDFSAMAMASDEAARKTLLALPGVGPWTADIYLLAALLRRDVWPVGDLALQEAARDLFSLEVRPGQRVMQALGQRFAPHRAVAARLLWSHYRGMKGLKQA